MDQQVGHKSAVVGHPHTNAQAGWRRQYQLNTLDAKTHKLLDCITKCPNKGLLLLNRPEPVSQHFFGPEVHNW